MTRTGSATRVGLYRDDALGRDDAVAISEKVKAGDISAAEVIEAAIERAEAANVDLNAVVERAYDRARRFASMEKNAPLFGVPSFIKDTDEVQGLPLYFGSNALAGTPSSKSSEMTKTFEAAGLSILGTSATPEFGLTGTTESLRFGATRNPWGTAYSTGGSSGGSSALVAAGVVPLAHANDGAGSIRIPASCCGLVGMKPSRGRLPHKEIPGYLPVNIFHEGVVTRSVRDTHAFYKASQAYHKPRDIPMIEDLSADRPKGLKIALLTEDCNGAACDSQNVQAAHHVARLCADLGHDIEPIPNPFRSDFDTFFWMIWAHVPFLLRHLGKSVIGSPLDYGKTQIWFRFLAQYGRKTLPRLPWALRRAKQFVGEYETALQRYDVLLTPTLGAPTPKIGYLGPDVDGATHMARIQPYIPFTKYQNISGAPAISLPLWTCANGMPMGVQLATAHGQDNLLLRLSAQLEDSAPWAQSYSLLSRAV